MAARASGSSKSKPTNVKKFSSARSETKRTTTASKKPAASGTAETPPEATKPDLMRRELLDAVMQRSGVRKKFAKPVVEAVMDVLGEAIAEGRGARLQPLGKITLQRSKDTPQARIRVVRVRQRTAVDSNLSPAPSKVQNKA